MQLELEWLVGRTMQKCTQHTVVKGVLKIEKYFYSNYKSVYIHSPNIPTTPLRQWGFRQCSSFSWKKLRGKHCRHPITAMGVVDTFRQSRLLFQREFWSQFLEIRKDTEFICFSQQELLKNSYAEIYQILVSDWNSSWLWLMAIVNTKIYGEYLETQKVRKYCFYCQTFKQKPVFLPLFCGKALWSEFQSFVQKLWGLIFL